MPDIESVYTSHKIVEMCFICKRFKLVEIFYICTIFKMLDIGSVCTKMKLPHFKSFFLISIHRVKKFFLREKFFEVFLYDNSFFMMSVFWRWVFLQVLLCRLSGRVMNYIKRKYSTLWGIRCASIPEKEFCFALILSQLETECLFLIHCMVER